MNLRLIAARLLLAAARRLAGDEQIAEPEDEEEHEVVMRTAVKLSPKAEAMLRDGAPFFVPPSAADEDAIPGSLAARLRRMP